MRLEKEAFKVLTQFGKEVSVPQHAVQARKTRAVALDHKQVSFKDLSDNLIVCYNCSVHFLICSFFMDM